MLKGLLVAASAGAAAAFGSVPALATQCPYDMSKIDAALAKSPKLSAADLARVKQLRAEGERLHRSGKAPELHAAAVKKFAEAKRILGIH